MRRINTSVTVLLVVAIGAAVTWLWLNREVSPAPAASSTTELQSDAAPSPSPQQIPGSSQSQPATQSAESRTLPESTSPVAPVAPASLAALPPVRDDSTYFRILAIAQARPRARDISPKVMQMHDNFLLSPDDPEWARPTEQALRDFFKSDDQVEVTSITCRSEGCEVQALGERLDVGARVVAPRSASLAADRPGGASIVKSFVVSLDLGDRMGHLIQYKRLGSKPVVLSPWEEPRDE